MALRSRTNMTTYCPTVMIDNATLNRYFKEHVPVQKEKTELIREEVLRDLEAILAYVNGKDQHYGEKGVRVGSSTMGLSVNTKGDIDYSVVFRLNPSELPSNKLIWNSSKLKPRCYGFKDQTNYDTTSLREDLKIVEKLYSLREPETGYHWLPCSNPGLADFVFNGDLIPFKVKRRFMLLLSEAIEQLGLRGDLKLSRISHGPALTFMAEVMTSDHKVHPVSVDMAVVIQAGLSFLPKMGWPVLGTAWPPPDKIRSIRGMGINLVAKKPFYWQLSFAELEKELVSEVDKDGGCRKDVHRIMKSVYYTVCKEDPALSSYMLKNVWFLELERCPYPEQWQRENLAERYIGCRNSLLECVNRRCLPQYFDRRVNLLKLDKIREIREDVEKIRSFSFDTSGQRKRPANDALANQPPKQFKGTVPNMWASNSLIPNWR